jgi:hypothetical protein
MRMLKKILFERNAFVNSPYSGSGWHVPHAWRGDVSVFY